VTADLPPGQIIQGNATLAVYGPLGGQLIGTDGGTSGTNAPQSIVAVHSDGSVTTLEQSVPGNISVVGRDDGGAWAWSVPTNIPACGSTIAATADVYTDDGSGARRLAQVSLGGGVTTISLAKFSLAGIVATGTNSCGVMGSSTLSGSPAAMIDPANGATVDLASRMGADCDFKDLADDGTAVCVIGGVNPNKPYNPSDPLIGPTLRVVSSSGRQTDRAISSLLATQCLALAPGNEFISADASLVAISTYCASTGGNAVLPAVILHLSSGQVTVPQSGGILLNPLLWTPDDVLIASASGTFHVTGDGLVTQINATYRAQLSINTG